MPAKQGEERNGNGNGLVKGREGEDGMKALMRKSATSITYPHNQQHITQQITMMSTSGFPKPSCTREETCTREAKAQARDITPYPFGANAHLHNLYNLHIYKQLQWEITI